MKMIEYDLEIGILGLRTTNPTVSSTEPLRSLTVGALKAELRLNLWALSFQEKRPLEGVGLGGQVGIP